jgi:hypothetical protein
MQFNEENTERTQEFLLRWSPDGGQTFQDIVRQQWNFSSPSSTCEEEDYLVEIPTVTVLELSIIPDINGKNSIASLAQLRLA